MCPCCANSWEQHSITQTNTTTKHAPAHVHVCQNTASQCAWEASYKLVACAWGTPRGEESKEQGIGAQMGIGEVWVAQGIGEVWVVKAGWMAQCIWGGEGGKGPWGGDVHSSDLRVTWKGSSEGLN